MNRDNGRLNKEVFFDRGASVQVTASTRILTTPSTFAKENLFYLQEIGELESLKQHKTHRKSLDSFLLVVITKGSGTFHYNNKNYHVHQNDIVFIDCKKPYYHITDKLNPWRLQWVHFNGSNVSTYFEYFYNKSQSIVLRNHSSENALTLLKSMYELADDRSIEMEFKLSHLISSLLTEIIIKEEKNEDSAFVKIKKVKEHIDINFKSKITLDSLSKEFYISKYYMSREFKSKYGITINNYISNKKISLAKELLRFSDMTIQEIGNRISITDNSYFNKVFKKIEGVSPSAFRNKWNGN